jgi:hypothetical protein
MKHLIQIIGINAWGKIKYRYEQILNGILIQEEEDEDEYDDDEEKETNKRKKIVRNNYREDDYYDPSDNDDDDDDDDEEEEEDGNNNKRLKLNRNGSYHSTSSNERPKLKHTFISDTKDREIKLSMDGVHVIIPLSTDPTIHKKYSNGNYNNNHTENNTSSYSYNSYSNNKMNNNKNKINSSNEEEQINRVVYRLFDSMKKQKPCNWRITAGIIANLMQDSNGIDVKGYNKQTRKVEIIPNTKACHVSSDNNLYIATTILLNNHEHALFKACETVCKKLVLKRNLNLLYLKPETSDPETMLLIKVENKDVPIDPLKCVTARNPHYYRRSQREAVYQLFSQTESSSLTEQEKFEPAYDNKSHDLIDMDIDLYAAKKSLHQLGCKRIENQDESYEIEDEVARKYYINPYKDNLITKVEENFHKYMKEINGSGGSLGKKNKIYPEDFKADKEKDSEVNLTKNVRMQGESYSVSKSFEEKDDILLDELIDIYLINNNNNNNGNNNNTNVTENKSDDDDDNMENEEEQEMEDDDEENEEEENEDNDLTNHGDEEEIDEFEY